MCERRENLSVWISEGKGRVDVEDVVGETLQVGRTKNEYKEGVEKARKETFRVKRLHGKFMMKGCQ